MFFYLFLFIFAVTLHYEYCFVHQNKLLYVNRMDCFYRDGFAYCGLSQDFDYCYYFENSYTVVCDNLNQDIYHFNKLVNVKLVFPGSMCVINTEQSFSVCKPYGPINHCTFGLNNVVKCF